MWVLAIKCFIKVDDDGLKICKNPAVLSSATPPPTPSPNGWNEVAFAWSVAVLYANPEPEPPSFWYALKWVDVIVWF